MKNFKTMLAFRLTQRAEQQENGEKPYCANLMRAAARALNDLVSCNKRLREENLELRRKLKIYGAQDPLNRALSGLGLHVGRKLELTAAELEPPLRASEMPDPNAKTLDPVSAKNIARAFSRTRWG